MTSLFYLALTDGTTTIELTDGVNYSISDESGWLPNVAFDTEQRTVVDSIPINILGALTAGGRSQAGRVRVNYIALLTMLRQIERGQNGDGGVVTLVYTSPNSAPARRIACQVTRWDSTTFPADISSVINLPQNEINEVVLTLEHRVPWVWQSYLYANLYPNSAWDVNPAPVSPGGVSTVAHALSLGYYGGTGKITITNGVTGDNFVYAGSPIFAVTSGVPIIVTYSAGWLTGISAIALALIDSGGTTVRSNYDSTTVSGSTAIATAGYRITATLTPTITGNVRLMWKVTGTILREAEFAEVFIHATEAETWHVDTALEGVGIMTPATTNIPTVYTATFPTPRHSPSPVTVTMGGIPRIGFTAGMGKSILSVTDGTIEAVNLPPASIAAPFTSVAEGGTLALGGTIMRYTPTVANTWSSIASANTAFPTRASFYIVARNNSLTTTFMVRITSGDGSDPNPILYTREIIIPPYVGAAKPEIYQLGAIYSDRQLSFYIDVQASAAAGTLDMDRLGVIEETEYTGVVTTAAIANTASFGGTYELQSRWLTSPAPRIVATFGGAFAYAFSSPDSPLIKTRGTTLRTLFDAVTYSGDWWRSTSDLATAIQPIPTVTRPPAFDAPL